MATCFDLQEVIVRPLELIATYNNKFVLYGCETSSLTLREERRLRVFENRVLRGIFEC
jgi:hypothetical protein